MFDDTGIADVYVLEYCTSRVTGIDSGSGDTVHECMLPPPCRRSLALSPTGRHLAIGCDDSSALVYDTATLTLIATCATLTSSRSVAYSPDGAWLAATDGLTVRLFDAASETYTQTSSRTIPGDGRSLCRLAFHSLSTSLVVSSYGGSMLAVVSVPALETLRSINITEAVPEYVSFDTSFATYNDVIAVTGSKVVPVLDYATLAIVHILSCFNQPIKAVALTPDNTLIALGGDDKRVSVFVAASFDPYSIIDCPNDVMSIAFISENALVAGIYMHEVMVYDVQAGVLLMQFNSHQDEPTSIAVVKKALCKLFSVVVVLMVPLNLQSLQGRF